MLTESCSKKQKFFRYNADCIADHSGPFWPFCPISYPKINNLINVRKRPTNFIILQSVPKIILIWLIVTKKWCAHQCRLFRPLFVLCTPFCLKNQNFWKIKKIPGDIIILHQFTKNYNRMICNSQNIMWIALQVILGHLCLLPIFWPKKPKLLKQRKNRREISSLYPKNHNHLMYSSLKMMPTASQAILGQFLPFYSIFGPKLKFSKIEKMSKTY